MSAMASDAQTGSDDDSYRSLLERSREIVYRVTTEGGLMHGKVTYVNPRTEELTGYSAKDFVDHPSLWASLVHADDLPGVFATTAQMAEQRAPVIHEYRIKGADGQHHWMEDRVAPLVDTTGRLIGYEGARLRCHGVEVGAHGGSSRAGATARRTPHGTHVLLGMEPRGPAGAVLA